MRGSKLLAIALSVTMLGACTEPNGAPGNGIMNGGAPDKQDVGTAIGVVGGALIGSAIGGGIGQGLAIVAGGLLGGVLGNAIGESMDNADRAAYNRASQRAMESGQTRSWRNSDSGNYGTITPHRRYVNDEGQYCRKYTQTIYIDGEKHTGHGIACRQDDGSWQVSE